MIVAPHGLPDFDYIKPGSIEEACTFLYENIHQAKPFSGGTDCFINLRNGTLKIRYMVDIKSLKETSGISFEPGIGLLIGAGVPLNKVASHPAILKNYPLLSIAASSVASYQLRNRATLIGNLCNSSPAADTAGACFVYAAKLNIRGVNGDRVSPINDFFLGSGKNILTPDEIVTTVWFPDPPKFQIGQYEKLGRNKSSDLAIVGVTTLCQPDTNLNSGYRFNIILSSVAPTPIIALLAEKILADMELSERTIQLAAQAAMEASSPIDDIRSSARYRKIMVRNLTRRALIDTWQKLLNQKT